MKPSVNLYARIPEEKTLFFSGKNMVFILLSWIVCLSIFSVFEQWRYTRLSTQLNELRETNTKMLTTIKQFGFKPYRNKKERQRETEVFQQELEAKKLEQKSITDLTYHTMDGLSHYFYDLAQATSTGISLKKIRLDGNEKKIALTGVARNVKLVSLYLNTLKKTPSFENKAFKLIKTNQGSDGVNFFAKTYVELEKKYAKKNR